MKPESGNQDIFSNLLECASENGDAPEIQEVSASNVVAILKDVVHMLVTQQKIITISSESLDCTLTVFEYTFDKACRSTETTESDSYCEIRKLYTLPFTVLKKERFDLMDFGLLSPEQIQAKADPTFQVIVVQKASDDKRDSKASDIQATLFQQLFGADLYLLNNPVIVVGTPCGRVYAFPSCTPPSGTKPMLLYELHEAIASVQLGDIANNPFELEGMANASDGESGANIIFIVGSMGSVVAMYVSKDKLCIHERRVDAPVYAACVKSNMLLHSTVADLFLTKFYFSGSENNKVETKVEKLGFHNAVQLQPYTFKSTKDAGDFVFLN